MRYSDSSEDEMTYEQEEKINSELERERTERNARRHFIDLKRKKVFEDMFTNQDEHIFHLKGLTIINFNHNKVKCMFVPSKIVKYVSCKVVFYCTLIYLAKYNNWCIKRDSFPVNYKWQIYPLFYKVDDMSLLTVIEKIYSRLVLWSKREETFRLEKFKKCQNGEDVYLDSDDEELFLNGEERLKLHKKRAEVLNRMIPPEKR